MFTINPFKNSGALSETEDLARKIFGMKRDALARAMHQVSKGKDLAVRENKPGISNYLRALREICAEQNSPLPLRAMMDLSDQHIMGYALTEHDFAVAEGELTLQERAQIGLDGDGDGHILTELFIAAGATLNSCSVDSRLAEKVHLPQFSEIHDLTIIELTAGQQVILDNGFPIDGVVIRMANGGVVIVAEDTVVRNCKISGNLEFHVRENAMVNGLNAEGACLVNLTAEKGAALENVNLEGATVACGSNFQGSVLKNVKVNGANLANIDFTGATIIGFILDEHTKITNCLLDMALDLEDIKIVSPDGTVRFIENIAELAGHGVKGKRGVKISVHGLGAILHQAMQAAQRATAKPSNSTAQMQHSGIKISSGDASLPSTAPASPNLKPDVQQAIMMN